MIAPLRKTDPPRRSISGAMFAARHAVAEMFLEEDHSAQRAPAVPAWKAWSFAIWTAAVAAIYLAVMLRG